MKFYPHMRLFVVGGIASLAAVGMGGYALSAHAAQAASPGTLQVVNAAAPVQSAPGSSTTTAQAPDTTAAETPETAATAETTGPEADGPGGHADNPADPNADHQFNGSE